MGLRFTGDSGKAERNQRRHQVSFEEAVEAFFDPNAVDDYDTEHSVTEHRYHLIGLASRRLLFVVFSEPAEGIVRIISARKADASHRRIYEQ